KRQAIATAQHIGRCRFHFADAQSRLTLYPGFSAFVCGSQRHTASLYAIVYCAEKFAASGRKAMGTTLGGTAYGCFARRTTLHGADYPSLFRLCFVDSSSGKSVCSALH